jgi:branched-chain amino acid transport system substrate-binding protein
MGAWVGKTTVRNGQGTMTDFRYIDGAEVQPPDAEVKKMRPE